MAQDIIARVKGLLTAPAKEWDAIDAETVEPQTLIRSYVAPLAAIPPAAGFIGSTLFAGAPFLKGLFYALLAFGFSIAWVFLFAWIINALAPSFGAQKNYAQALKTTAYSPTAGWVAGIFGLIPLLGILSVIGSIYSLYLLFVGLPKMMKPPADKALPYTLVSIAAAIVAALIIGGIVGGFASRGGDGFYSSGAGSEERADDFRRAAESGDIGGMAAALGSGPVATADSLKKLAPSRLAGLKQTTLDVQSMSFPIKASVLNAEYGEGDRRVTLTIASSPAVGGMLGVLGLDGGAEYDRSSSDGYERLKRSGDGFVIEEWSKSKKRGRYARTLAGFLVSAEGEGVAFNDLERAVKSFSENELKRLPTAEG